MNRQLKAYKQVRVTTASPGEIIVLLYEGLIRFTASGRRALESNVFADAAKAFESANAIIVHLLDSLDEGASPELTAHLRRMYVAWSVCLMKSQVNRDFASLDTIIAQMKDMTETWRTASMSAVAEGA